MANGTVTSEEQEIQQVDSLHPEYAALQEDLILVDDLRQGTRRMREHHNKYLPQFAAEEEKNYERRWKSSTLFNAFEETIGYFTGRAFASPPALEDDVPLEIKGEDDELNTDTGEVIKQGTEGLAENIDNAGNHLTIFAQRVFKEALRSGAAGILVDMPPMPVDEEGNPLIRTQAEERAANRRPYWVLIRAKQIIGWKVSVESGFPRLTQVRILERVEEDAGRFETEMVEQVRVLEIGLVTIYRKIEDRWQVHATNEMKGPDGAALTYIPFVALVFDEDGGFLVGQPPLLDLAYLNVKHYQKQSDYDNGITAACFPQWAVSGWQGEDDGDKMAVGPFTVVKLKNPQAKMYFVEHSGAAFGAARQDLQDLKDDMALSGLKLLIPKTGQTPTATGEAIGEARTSSQLQTFVLLLKDALEVALDFTGRWLNKGEGSGGSVTVNTESLIMVRGDIDSLLKAGQLKQLPTKIILREMVRRGFLADDTDIDEVLELLEEESAKNTALTGLAGSFLQPQGNRPPQNQPPVEGPQAGSPGGSAPPAQ